jgi:hypothetical protein
MVLYQICVFGADLKSNIVSLHVKEGNNLPINQAPSSKIKKQCLDTTKQYF